MIIIKRKDNVELKAKSRLPGLVCVVVLSFDLEISVNSVSSVAKISWRKK
jgi:hypothetical protein